MSETNIASIVSALEDALDTEVEDGYWDCFTLASHVVPKFRSSQEPNLTDILFASVERGLSYTLSNEGKKGALDLASIDSSSNGDWPPPLCDATDDDLETWKAVFEAANHPLLKAHFGDLCFSARALKGRDVALGIIEGYEYVADLSTVDPLYRAECLRRAWTLSRIFDTGDEQRIRHRAFEFCRLSIEKLQFALGIMRHLLVIQCVTPKIGEFRDPSKQELLALISTIWKSSSPTSFTLESLTELALLVAENQVEREQIVTRLFNHLLSLGKGESAGVSAVYWMEKALKLAQNHELPSLRQEALIELQNIQLEDLDLQKLSVEFALPRAVAEWRSSYYRGANTAVVALRKWLTTGSPTGNHKSNRELVQDQSQGRILSLGTRIRLDRYGNPTSISSGPEGFVDEELDTHESFIFQVQSLGLAGDLRLIQRKFGPPAPAEIELLFTQGFGASAELARAWAECVALHWEGNYSASAKSSYPLIEAGIRGLLLHFDSPVYVPQSGTKDGHFQSLETYCQRLEAIDFDEDWISCIRGPISRLRNELAHGHLLFVSENDSAALLRVAGLFVSLSSPNLTKFEVSRQAKLHSRELCWPSGCAVFPQQTST